MATKINSASTLEADLRATLAEQGISLQDYESIALGSIIETSVGDFYLESKPNLYQGLDDRTWTFSRICDEEGEPIMDGEIIKLR